MAAIFAVAALVSGCSQGSSPSIEDGPYAARFEQAYSDATTDFEREVLSDGTISRGEFEEAISRFVDCVRDAGADIKLVETYDWYSYETRDPAEDFDAAADPCAVGTKFLIEPLYVDIHQNPQNLDPFEAFADCLRRNEVVEPGFTAQEMQELMESDNGSSPEADRIKQDPNYLECMRNPATGSE